MTADPLRDFERLIAESTAAPGATASQALLRALSPDSAELLRLCAIPHEITPDVLRALQPGLDPERAGDQMEELARLSCVISNGDALALHDATRADLFAHWLAPGAIDRFREISARLQDLFRRQAEANMGSARDACTNQCVFHQVGANQAAGFAAFEQLCRTARHGGRLSTCTSLVRMISEYSPVLTQERQAWLAYHQAKLAADQQRSEDAERAFNALLLHPGAPPSLLIKARLRLGMLFSERGQHATAISHYTMALELARTSVSTNVQTYDILRSLGEAYRDQGDLARAETLLTTSLDQAKEARDDRAIADAHNSVGTLRFRMGELPEAIAAYEASLALLASTGQRFQSAQVYNNIGLAQAEQGNWEEAARQLATSLEIKREMGDSLGQAKTLLNLVRVHRGRGDMPAARATCERALRLFETLRHLPGQAKAHQTLGRLLQISGDDDAARGALERAGALFERARDTAATAAIKQEIASVSGRRGLPWWTWVPILGLAVVTVLGVVLYLASR